MISLLGPLNASERAQVQKSWSAEKADSYLPLLLDGHPLSRDLLLLTLGSEQTDVRDAARRALKRFPKTAQSQPVPNAIRGPLLAALERDPIAEAAPYLARLNATGHEEKIAGLLRSAEPSVVSSAYSALFLNNQPKAFNLLLSEMGRVTSAEQAQAIGEMLLSRHAGRSDGFYLKFARDISGDKTRPIAARASGLHAVLRAGGTEALPPFTPERAEALAFLVSSQPFITQETYLPFLKKVKAERELNYIWSVAQKEKWINRDKVAAFYKGEKIENTVISDLLKADDYRSFKAGAIRVKPIHNNLLRAQADSAIKSIGDLARQKLKLPARGPSKTPCRISRFDSNDSRSQMPFFDTGWMKTDNGMRVALDRKYLTAAHPSKAGWLAGYKLKTDKSRAALSGGALVHFDNKTGGFERVGNFSGPITILPDRALKLGQTTDRFWIIENWENSFSDVSAFLINLSTPQPQIRHMSALPKSANRFSVAPNGDLLMRFEDEKQVPMRLKPSGDLSLACAALRGTPKQSAPN